MDALELFRREVRTWAEQHCPPSQREPATTADIYRGGRLAEFPSEDARIWFERMLERGWTVPDWPSAYGGAGLDPAETRVLRAELKTLGCRIPLSGIGIWMLGPALLEFGTEDQKQRHLPAIARGEIRWCQGYSEPGAGSDLASLQCRATGDGEYFRVSGTKIWTSDADKADWMFCLVRTDPDAPKHEGISFLLLDMRQEGVSVSPIKLISGDSDFCQTFLDNATAHRDDLVGGLNRGWRVAKRLLQHERKLMSELAELAVGPKLTPVDCARHYVGPASGRLRDPLLRDRLARHEMDTLSLQLAQRKAFDEARSASGTPSAGSYFKYYASELDKSRGELMLALMGCRGLGWEQPSFSNDEVMVSRQWAHSKILSIAGGTSEIQLNVIAKRVLGLPD